MKQKKKLIKAVSKIKLLACLVIKKWDYVTKGRRGKIYKKNCQGTQFAMKKAIDKSKFNAINKEAKILKYLKEKKIKFVPEIILEGKGKFIYKRIEGNFFEDYEITKDILKDLANKAYKLDKIGVFHGELDKPTKNVLISNGKIKIIDFDRGKIFDKSITKNLRHIAQYLHSLRILEIDELKKIGEIKEPNEIKKFLNYKIENDKNFSNN